jgi:hypothetical protein
MCLLYNDAGIYPSRGLLKSVWPIQSLGHCATKARQTASSCLTYRRVGWPIGSFASHKVNLKSLLGPRKERFVLASFQVLSECVLSVEVDSASASDARYE